MHRLATRLGRCFASASATASATASASKPASSTVLHASSISASGVIGVVAVASAVAAAATAAATTATAASMAAYSSAVSMLEPAADIPDEVRQASHHVKGSHGKTVKFQNPHPSAGGGSADSLFVVGRKVFWAKITGDMADSAPDASKVKIPMVKPELLTSRTGSSALRATWLGHACYFVEFPSGLRVLFDPVFEDRCAPVQWLGPKRYTPPACALSELPPVDAVVISHSHYDHLSLTSVRDLAKRNPDAQFFVGLGLEKWFQSSGITKVTEMDWWQDADLVLHKTTKETDPAAPAPDTISARVTCLPCQHSSGRTGRDKDHTLWASWAVKSGGKSVWFGGDTGYRNVPHVPVDIDDYGPAYDSLPRCPQFGQIGRLRGPFDLGLIPIGAYKPRWLFSWMHANPYDAVEIFKETRCKRAMGIHWGTWVLTSEDVEEPPKMLKEALRTSGLPETGVFDVCAVGESREF